MKIGKVDVCDHCGAAYTPHAKECPDFGKEPPMEKVRSRQIELPIDNWDEVTPTIGDFWKELERE